MKIKRLIPILLLLFATAISAWAQNAQIPSFDVHRGFYDAPFDVELSVSDAATKIYYTTDGTRPTKQSTLYTQAIPITTTTVLSAVGVKDNLTSSVNTHTYFFIDDIIKQTNALGAAYPASWGYLGADISYTNYKVGDRAPAHYAMDAQVCHAPAYAKQLEDAFLALPSMNIVTNPGFLFSDTNDATTGGIYIHTGVSVGDGWERPISLEYYDPATKKHFQINCGLRLHGAASRQPEKTGKHSFRVVFRKEYGFGKLSFNLFEKETAVKQFDHLVLRAGYNLSWTHPDEGQRKNSQYTIDSFVKRTQQNMGNLAPHDRFVHLFINGLYWGLYNVSERINDKFLEAYLGGSETDYDIMNHNGLAEGVQTAYDRMVSLGRSGDYEQLLSEQLLDMENFIDYMLLNFYIGNLDWPHNNWYAARNRTKPGKGFQFFSWDAETSLTDVNKNRVVEIGGDFRRILFGSSTTFSETGGLYHNNDFNILFADRVQKHFFNDGSLTPPKTAALFQELSEEIDQAIILESARWGSYRKDVMTPKSSRADLYTRNDHWLPRKEKLLKDYFPKRAEIVYQQLKAVGLLPEISAPLFSSYGEESKQAIELTITSPDTNVKIYYTSDGSDPRVAGDGEVSATALEYTELLCLDASAIIKARAKKGNEWSALSEANFIVKKEEPEEPKEPEEPETGIPSFESPDIHFVENSICFNLLTTGRFTLTIYSLEGIQIQQTNAYGVAGTNRVELIRNAPGVYLIRLQSGNETVSKKLLRVGD